MRAYTSLSQNDCIAQCSFLRAKIRKNIKWLFINLVASVILTSECIVSVDTVYSSILALICFLNACFYVGNSVVLYIRILKLELGTATHGCNASALNNQAQGLVRYFENHSLTFLCWYWEYFDHLVRSLEHFRLKRFGLNVERFRIESELRNLEQNLKQSHLAQAKRLEDFEDPRYRLPSWWRYDRNALEGHKQLAKYWNEYLDVSKNELVTYSTVQDLPSVCNSCRGGRCNVDCKHLQVPVSDIFSRLAYQLSSGAEASETSQDADRSSYADLFTAMRVQHKEKHFNPSLWVTNLRRWLSMKIKGVVQQFDAANCLLTNCGVPNVRVGSSDVVCLQSVFQQVLKSQLPLLAFLTLTHDQGYLVWRYRVLSSDECMKHFSWNSGGAYREAWNPAMYPNDSEIVLHFFANYLDMMLPCYPSHSTCKRPFSDSYVLTGPNRKTPQYMNLAIIQRWVTPPHFNIIVEGRQMEMPHGNSNIFLTIGYLLYCIKTYHNGKIGRVSLGKHGLNLLWIVGDDSHS